MKELQNLLEKRKLKELEILEMNQIEKELELLLTLGLMLNRKLLKDNFINLHLLKAHLVLTH